MIWPILEAKAEIRNYFRSFFGSNEDIQKSFGNYLTFSDKLKPTCGVQQKKMTECWPLDTIYVVFIVRPSLWCIQSSESLSSTRF